MWLVRSWPTPSPGFRLKVAEIHEVYMAVSGESVCEEVHPCRVIIIYSNAGFPDMETWTPCTVHRQVKVDTLKYAR